MAEKKFKAPETSFWADNERTFGGDIMFGDEVTGLIDDERLEKWLGDGTVTEDKPDSTAHASQTKLTILTAKVAELEVENAELKSVSKVQKSGTSKKAAKEIAKLEESVIDWELKVDYLTEMVQEIEKTWKAPEAK